MQLRLLGTSSSEPVVNLFPYPHSVHGFLSQENLEPSTVLKQIVLLFEYGEARSGDCCQEDRAQHAVGRGRSTTVDWEAEGAR